MLKLGLIGAGGEAWQHLRGCVHSGRVRSVVLAEPEADSAAALRRRFGVIKSVVADPQELLADPEIALVDVCAPLAERPALARAALEAGKHVILDLPPAQSAEEFAELQSLASSRQLRLLCAVSDLFIPANLKLAELLRAGGLPRPVTVQYASGEPAAEAAGWWRVGVFRALTVLRQACGTAGSCAAATWSPTALALQLRLPDEAVAQVAVWRLEEDQARTGERRYYGPEGFALVRDNPEDEMPLLVGRGIELYPIRLKTPPDVYEYAAIRMMEHLLECVEEGKPETLPAEAVAEALAVQEACEGLFRNQV